MADYLLILLALLTLTSSSTASEVPLALPREQLNNIIDALIGAGDFNNWANVLSGSDFFILPLSTTLFVPSDDFEVSSATSADPWIIPYHIVPLRLSFSELSLLKPGSRLPTLLPSKTILITNTSASHFTLDGSLVSRPDLYLTSSVAVHGIATSLDYKLYGSVHRVCPSPPPPPTPPSATTSLPTSGMLVPVGGVISGACLCEDFPIVFLVVCGSLILKIVGK